LTAAWFPVLVDFNDTIFRTIAAITSDLIIYPERIDANWWRREGHRLTPEDLPESRVAEKSGRSYIMSFPDPGDDS
jgi:hypothetical protein